MSNERTNEKNFTLKTSQSRKIKPVKLTQDEEAEEMYQ